MHTRIRAAKGIASNASTKNEKENDGAVRDEQEHIEQTGIIERNRVRMGGGSEMKKDKKGSI